MDNLLNRIHFADCLEVLRSLPDGSVDLFLQDPPYGVTNNDWDIAPDFGVLWNEWRRVGKSNAAFLFTATQPFATDLINSWRKGFRYDWVWEKNAAPNIMTVKFRPLAQHEHILCFYVQKPTYNPQRISRTKESLKRTPAGVVDKWNGGKSIDRITGQVKARQKIVDIDGLKNPISVLKFDVRKERNGNSFHCTPKPIDLFRYLIRTYSNPGDVVFDGYGGSGTTAIAAQMEGRKFIVCENHLPYFEASQARLSNLVAAPYLFSDCG